MYTRISESPIDRLIGRVRKLPGMGPRSAQRLVLHMLRQRETVLQPLIDELNAVSEAVKSCEVCRNLDVTSPCHICSDSSRDRSMLCVVEDVADLWALERGQYYNGLYFVLGGALSVMEDTGPEALGIPLLLSRLEAEPISEMILATSATVDGQTTAFYITEQLNNPALNITRLSQGIPLGSELDYVDNGTLNAAFMSRRAFE